MKCCFIYEDDRCPLDASYEITPQGDPRPAHETYTHSCEVHLSFFIGKEGVFEVRQIGKKSAPS